MTSFSPEPEFWIEDGTNSGSDDGWGDWDDSSGSGGDHGGPSGPQDPRGPGGPDGGGHRRWPRWVALAAGLAVIAGLIVWQGQTKQSPPALDQADSQTSPMTAPLAPPSTWAPTATGPVTDRTGTPDRPTDRTDEPGTDDATVVPPTSDTGVAMIATKDPQLALPDAQGWELQAYRRSLRPGGHVPLDGDAAVIRYLPKDGQLIGIAIPGLQTTGPVSFVARGETAIIRPLDPVPGFVISPEGTVSPAVGEFASAHATYVYPGPGSDQVWAVNLNSFPATVRLADITGRFLGAEFTPPDPLAAWPAGYGMVPDGTGYLMTPAIGGTYLLQPVGDGFRRVTTGIVLAAGPPGFLTYDCDETAHCHTYYVDRGTWAASKLPVDYVPSGGILPTGVISPDGTKAALAGYGGSGAVVYLLDLTTGDKTYTDVSLTDSSSSGLFAFSPDSRYLMVAGLTGVVPVEVATGTALPTVPTGPVDALAIVPIS